LLHTSPTGRLLLLVHVALSLYPV